MTASGRAAMARHQPPPATTVQQSISKFFTRQTGNGNPTPAAVATARQEKIFFINYFFVKLICLFI